MSRDVGHPTAKKFGNFPKYRVTSENLIKLHSPLPVCSSACRKHTFGAVALLDKVGTVRCVCVGKGALRIPSARRVRFGFGKFWCQPIPVRTTPIWGVDNVISEAHSRCLCAMAISGGRQLVINLNKMLSFSIWPGLLDCVVGCSFRVYQVLVRNTSGAREFVGSYLG